MKTIFKISIMILLPFFFGSNCSSQDNKSESGLVDRKPAVAGQFYASSPNTLKSDLSKLFAKALPKQSGVVLALIAPHAGYVFSGEVAATSFNQLDPDKKYNNIFILASSHRMSFEGASIYNKGDYITPLGKVKVNLDVANQLLNDYPVFNSKAEAHISEHSLEVQLPFLQYRLKQDFQIIPIILGTQSPSTSKKIAEALKPFLNEKNLFVISSDFSHYPSYEDACLVDKITATAITMNSPDILLKTLEDNDGKGIDNLATSLCGWTSVLSLLYMTEGRQDLTYKAIEYQNSGDSKIYGDTDRVVGYYSIVVEKKSSSKDDKGFSLDDQEKEKLLDIARQTMEEYVSNGKIPVIDEKTLSPILRQPFGAFVTLRKDGDLRGCIGRFEAVEPLYKVVQQMAISASTQDSRFPEVTPAEFDKIDIEISVLTPLRKINSIDEFQLGKHGIYMKKGFSTGTFLPQVAQETGWTTEEFLGHCARDKARIGWDGWKDAELYVYEAYVFGEKE
ncbi:MAG: AmmeMemoRadiSam system protein B [Bacteroidales bacterium]|nr:AmmeMemoRadiSam system protein B [Bacteroidales bacterium]